MLRLLAALLLMLTWQLIPADSLRTAGPVVEMQQQRPSDDIKASVQLASAVLDGAKLRVIPGKLQSGAVAQARFDRSLNSSGWDVLDVKAQYSRNDSLAMYAAGLLEGFLTADRIVLHYRNMLAALLPDVKERQKLLPRIREFLDQQYRWAWQFARSNKSAIARHTGLVMSQFDGLVDGYLRSDASRPQRDRFVLLFLNAVGDLLDLKTALNITKPNFPAMSSAEFAKFIRTSGHCSALVKLTPGLENIFMGHSSWFVYAATLRIYKHYNFILADRDAAARRISFSSYPAFLESLDDFYIMDSGLVMLQTTNNVFNTSLYKSVRPQSLLSWQRVRVANQIARNGSAWARVMDTHNSGTYNNQYMIIDLNKVHLKSHVEDGALTIVEQIPTLVAWSDQTNILRAGYWPSYNVPFHEQVYNMSGYPGVVKSRGLDFSYQMAPRAKIFRREANGVVDDHGMARVLRFNDYKKDPYSENNSCNSICCRGDLLPGADAVADGCYDSKFTDGFHVQHMVSFAINGPSTGSNGHQLPPFAWSKFPKTSHQGLPSVYKFGWVPMQPNLI